MCLEQSLKEKSGSEKRLDESKECESGNDSTHGTESVVAKLSEDVEKSTAKHKQSESESPADIAEQVCGFSEPWNVRYPYTTYVPHS